MLVLLEQRVLLRPLAITCARQAIEAHSVPRRESLGDGLYGLDVYRAFWYAMASLVILAIAFRIFLSGLPPPTDNQLDEHRHWPPMLLFCLYLVAAALSLVYNLITLSICWIFFTIMTQLERRGVS